MPDPSTPRLGLYQPKSDGSEFVNVERDLNENWDKLDLNTGYRSCTSTTRPSSPYTGMPVRESDTGRTLVWAGSAWVDIYNSAYGISALSTTSITATTTGATAVTAKTTAVGTAATPVAQVEASGTTKRLADLKVTGDTQGRVRFDCSAGSGSGTLQFGNGSTMDVNLYRSAADTLRTDDSLSVGGDASIGGSLTVGGVGFPVIKYKTASTDRTSSPTLTADPDLSITLEASATYLVEMVLFQAATTAAPIVTDWQVPAGATGTRSAVGPAFGVSLDSGSGGTGRWGVHNYSTGVQYGHRNNNTFLARCTEESVITTVSAGTLALRWAQATSSTTATRLGFGSYMKVTRLA